jgi:acetyl esterase/lipase
VHGGGFIAGSITSHKDLAARIAAAAGADVLIFNYRLAPEHPFPAGLSDVQTLYQWMVDTYASTHRISVAGDSAGAGLALSLVCDLAKHGHALPACAVLLSPWLDLACTNPSHTRNRKKDPMLSPAILKKTAHLYTDKDLTHPLISPIHGNFQGLCPVLIQAGENEILLDDAIFLAEKLTLARVPVDIEIWPDMFHVWHYFARYLSEARKAIERIGSYIRQYS